MELVDVPQPKGLHFASIIPEVQSRMWYTTSSQIIHTYSNYHLPLTVNIKLTITQNKLTFSITN